MIRQSGWQMFSGGLPKTDWTYGNDRSFYVVTHKFRTFADGWEVVQEKFDHYLEAKAFFEKRLEMRHGAHIKKIGDEFGGFDNFGNQLDVLRLDLEATASY